MTISSTHYHGSWKFWQPPAPAPKVHTRPSNFRTQETARNCHSLARQWSKLNLHCPCPSLLKLHWYEIDSTWVHLGDWECKLHYSPLPWIQEMQIVLNPGQLIKRWQVLYNYDKSKYQAVEERPICKPALMWAMKNGPYTNQNEKVWLPLVAFALSGSSRTPAMHKQRLYKAFDAKNTE